jgi:L-seryl-tRNA(Ser) seleniumtransferase
MSGDDPRADVQARLRELPKVDEVLRRSEIAALAEMAPRWAVVESVRREIDRMRKALLSGGASGDLDADAIAARTAELVQPSLRAVINATGVVLHTNLGRAPLAEAAVARVAEIARGYSNLEYDLEGRGRGSRHDHLSELLATLCGAEAAVVVNNNAAAVLLCLASAAAGREVIVSRGELIEIGGSFRIPDVMRASGARLVEVGTTNKTHPRDYENAVGSDTALLLKVHRSNFAVVGFTEEVEPAELVSLGRARGVPVMIDLGSGTMLDPAGFAGAGLPAEPTVGAAVASGAALVTFSGDKLLGGPQAGVIAGSKQAVARARAHPLMRAVRPDKMTLAALEATLALYRDGRALEEVPAVRMLAATPAALRAKAEQLARLIGADRAAVVEITSAVGGGALPTAEPASWAVALSGRSADDLDAALRAGEPPIVGRIAEDRLLLDVRTIADTDLDAVASAVQRL